MASAWVKNGIIDISICECGASGCTIFGSGLKFRLHPARSSSAGSCLKQHEALPIEKEKTLAIDIGGWPIASYVLSCSLGCHEDACRTYPQIVSSLSCWFCTSTSRCPAPTSTPNSDARYEDGAWSCIASCLTSRALSFRLTPILLAVLRRII